MAPSTRARRHADMSSKAQLSSAADCGPAAPSNDMDNDNRRKTRHAGRDIDKAGVPQDHRQWTPEPEPHDAEEYTAWGRKHYGDDWNEQREMMLQERNFYDTGVDKYNDTVYLNRQKALRIVERTKEKGKLPQTKAKTWVELMAWARVHYGEVWWAQREALEQDEREKREAVDPNQRNRKSLKAAKRWLRLREIQRTRDEEMLAEGKTWHDIMAKPVESLDTLPPVGTGADVSLPSSSEHSDGSGYSTYPPTPSNARRQAIAGPQGPQDQWDWGWEFLEWDTVRCRLSETQYEERKVEVAARIRSWREDEECERRNRQELEEIYALKWTDQRQYYLKKEQRERRVRDLDLRLNGWTQEQIDAMDREKAAARKEYQNQLRMEPPKGFWGRPITQEERDEVAALLQKDRQDLARLVAQYETGSNHGPSATASRQLEASPPRRTKDTSRKVLGRRITKLAAQNQSDTRRCTRSRQPTPSAKTPTTSQRSAKYKRGPKVLDEPGLGTVQAQRIPRRSRRLAGQLPEFSTLLSDPPPRYETLQSSHLETHKTSSSDPRRGRLTRRPMTAKIAKPQGISKSRQDGAAGLKRRIK
ncbi:hypothetical protein HIM_10619 [Hirsutella minnesotensis 3608]|uniref:Uncharacterized protein n=1 Tax=Hirsutella minnesotensis 3608 TaxID=1043627 RepID=A0A0F7ZX27_9HYPO|nr:hypothetical protein HIM_10619 [Hirsutella minnesotensis 3608]